MTPEVGMIDLHVDGVAVKLHYRDVDFSGQGPSFLRRVWPDEPLEQVKALVKAAEVADLAEAERVFGANKARCQKGR